MCISVSIACSSSSKSCTIVLLVVCVCTWSVSSGVCVALEAVGATVGGATGLTGTRLEHSKVYI